MSDSSTHLQLSLYGDGVPPGTDPSKHPWTYSDSVRGMLDAGVRMMPMHVTIAFVYCSYV